MWLFTVTVFQLGVLALLTLTFMVLIIKCFALELWASAY
ncbi:secreted protein [gut metagenome]|uniref:Secreted protein n=1 Tax=gut metagenome TaxID=749906 RepID=J9BVU8_9ZZZZ